MIKQRAQALSIWDKMDPDLAEQPNEISTPNKPTLGVTAANFPNTMTLYNINLKEYI